MQDPQVLKIIQDKVQAFHPGHDIKSEFFQVDCYNKLMPVTLKQRVEETAKLSDAPAWNFDAGIEVPTRDPDGYYRMRVVGYLEVHNGKLTGNVFIAKPPEEEHEPLAGRPSTDIHGDKEEEESDLAEN